MSKAQKIEQLINDLSTTPVDEYVMTYCRMDFDLSDVRIDSFSYSDNYGADYELDGEPTVDEVFPTHSDALVITRTSLECMLSEALSDAESDDHKLTSSQLSDIEVLIHNGITAALKGMIVIKPESEAGNQRFVSSKEIADELAIGLMVSIDEYQNGNADLAAEGVNND